MYCQSGELRSLRDFIRWGVTRMQETGCFHGHGFARALDESVYLVLHSLSLPPDWPESYFDCQLNLSERLKISRLIEQRVTQRLPSAYLTNEAWFAGLPFYVDERVLVPRSPFAELIQKHFLPWLELPANPRILDLCTGSGCIAIAAQYAFEDAEVHASDISPDALEVARINCEKHGLSDYLQLHESDLFDAVPKIEFDLIISNPPYVDAEDMVDLPLEFTHEPRLGLASGDDGLDLTLQMLTQAPDYLSDEGAVIVEVGNSAQALQSLLPQVPFVWLEFERGGEGVFMLSAPELRDYRAAIEETLIQRKDYAEVS